MQKSVESSWRRTGEKRLKVFKARFSIQLRPAEETENETVKERIDDEDRIEKHRWNYETRRYLSFILIIDSSNSPRAVAGKSKIKDLLIHQRRGTTEKSYPEPSWTVSEELSGVHFAYPDSERRTEKASRRPSRPSKRMEGMVE